MEKFVIEGGKKLTGTVTVSGAKNAALPILAATLLSDEPSVVKNVPNLRDINTMIKILRNLGVKVSAGDGIIRVEPKGYAQCVAPYKLVSTMRASICVMGPLLAKKGFAQVSLPGGCVIGPRPIDLHIKGIKALGAHVTIEGGYVHAKAKRLSGTTIYLGGSFGSSVLATANVMMAATLARGITIIENASCEPEIVDLADMLVKMGAKIKGQKTHIIEIEGVKKLSGAEHTIIPDRIEAGTFMVAAAMTNGDIEIRNAKPEHLGAVIDKLTEAGAKIRIQDGKIKVLGRNRLKPINVTTHPFPGFPTDMQAQLMAAMCVTEGISVITEKVYPERFIHISELNRMGAQVMLEGSSAIVRGIPRLSGAPVMASDLRASAALVLAGLVARGRTDVLRIYHIDRGYEKIEEKFRSLGAEIRREKEE
ncbi:MAG: UDP-N-acetylglucosamine 1-carboxyvinyltransferase [Candidatus Omnitrophota bacterium]